MSDLVQRLYATFSPAPLRAEDKDLYVNLDEVRGEHHLVSRLAGEIRLSAESGSPTCQLLAGHHGSGKSTELRRLQAELQRGSDRFFVVLCQLDQDIDLNDVDFPDVLVAVVRQLAEQLKRRAKITLKPGYFRSRWEELREFFGSDVKLDKIELAAGMLTLAGALKGSPSARSRIRGLLDPDTSNLLHATNSDVIGVAKQALLKKGYRDLVIIVDDLDKMITRMLESGVAMGINLFVNRQAQLRGFQCPVVYSMPLALAYSECAPKVAGHYGRDPHVIPMTQLRRRDGAPNEAGMAKFRELVERRLKHAGAQERQVFQDDAVREEILRLSGGQPREVFHLIREALISGELPITPEAVQRAAREGTRAYQRILREEHWKLIEEVRATKSVKRREENDRAFWETLDCRAVLQYLNADVWYDLNPLVERLKNPFASP
jgi:hypothetical protein